MKKGFGFAVVALVLVYCGCGGKEQDENTEAKKENASSKQEAAQGTMSTKKSEGKNGMVKFVSTTTITPGVSAADTTSILVNPTDVFDNPHKTVVYAYTSYPQTVISVAPSTGYTNASIVPDNADGGQYKFVISSKNAMPTRVVVKVTWKNDLGDSFPYTSLRSAPITPNYAYTGIFSDDVDYCVVIAADQSSFN